MSDLAKLGIQVTSDAPSAADGLDKLATSASKAQKATDTLRDSSKSATSATSGLRASASDLKAALAQTGNDLSKATALLADHSANATKATNATNTLSRAHGGLSTQAMALSHSLRGAAEMLAQGVPPSRVLAMELNNITYAATGPGGLAGAFASLTQGALGTALKFAALASPVLALIALMGATADAAYKSAEANREFENTLSGIGRTGSASLSDVDQAAKQASASVGVSISTTQEWARAYATAGKVGGDVLVGLTRLTKEYAEATGKDTTDAVKALATAFSDPAKGAETLNDQLGFLNVTQMTHIKQLADEGDRLGAQKALYADLNKALDDTAQVHVHGLVKAWQDVATWASNAWHAMVIAAGGGDLLDDLNKASKILSDDLAKGWGENTDAIKFDRAEVEKAKSAYDAFNTSLKKTQDQTAANKATKAAQPIIDKMFPDDATLRKLQADYDTLARAQKAAAAAGETPDQYAKTTDALLATGQAIGRVTEAYKQYGGSAGVAHEIANLQAKSAATTDQATKGQIQTQIHLLQTLGDLTPAQQRLTAAQDAGRIVADKVHKSTDGVVTSYNKTLQALEDQTAAQDALNAQVAGGSITVQQAIAQEKLDKDLKSQIASIETDTKLTLQQKLDMIQKLTVAQKNYNASQDVGELQQITDEMQQQVKLAGMSADERDRENAVLSAQHRVNTTLHEDDAKKIRDLVDQQKAAEQLGKVADGVTSSFQDFFTTVFEGGKDAFHNLVDSIKNQFAQLLAWMVIQAIAKPIIVRVVGAITGGAMGAAGILGAGGSGISNIFGSLGSMSSGAGALSGATGFLGNIGTQISGAASWLTGGINALGSKLGFSGGTSVNGISTVGVTPSITGQGGFAAPNIAGSSSVLGGSTLLGTLGSAFAGYGLGSLGASLLGGNKSSAQQTNGMIGAAAGAAIGSVVPVIGTMLGAALGGVIGGLIGPKESAHRATANFDANYALTGVTGTKLTAEGQQAASGAGQTIAQVAAALQSAGLTLTNNIDKLTISTARDKSFITTSDGKRIDVGAVGDTQAAVQGTLKYLFDGLKSGDKDVQQVINHYKALGGLTADNAQQFGDDLTFAQNLRTTTHQVTVQLGNAADALAQVKTAYDADIERAKSLGLSTSQLIADRQKDIAAMQKQTSDAYVALFQSATASLKPGLSDYQTAAKQISDGLKQAASDMKALGGSLTAVTAAANTAKAALAATFNNDIKTQLTNALSPIVGSFDQLSATWAQRTADAHAVGGNMSLVSQLNTAEFQKFIAGLSDADRQVLISSGVMNTAQVALARSLGKVSDGIDSLIDNATAAATAAQQASQAWMGAQQSLDQSRKALLVSGPGVSPQNAYLAAQAQYNDLLAKSKTDPQAASDFASFASTFLQASNAYNATGGQFGADQAKVQSDLASLSSYAGTQATAADKLAIQAQASADALNAIKAELASGGPSIAVLQQQLKVQQDLNATMNAVLGRLGGGHAGGGAVSVGMSYPVGERGPELFTPGANGFITPNISLPTPRGGFSNDNGVDELKAEIEQMRADASGNAKLLASLLQRVEQAISKSGGDQTEALQAVRRELKHGTSTANLHGKARKNRK